MLPIGFLVAFAAGFAIHFAVPWMGSGGPSGDPEWLWAHQLSDEMGRDAPKPHAWALSGLIVGAACSLVWLMLTIAIPPRFWTPAREAAVASTVGAGLFFTMTGGAMGIGYAIMGGWGDSWAVSIAGWILVAGSAAGAIILAMVLLRRVDRRRTPLFLFIGSIFATGLFQAVPWFTIFSKSFDGSTDVESYTRIGFAFFGGDDSLQILGAAILTLAFGSLAWLLAVTLLPSHPRADPLIDTGFALAGLTPVLLAAVGVGRSFGGGLAELLRTGDDTAPIGWNAYLFSALLGLTLFALARTLWRGSHAVQEAWSS